MRSVSRALDPKPRRLPAKTGNGLAHFAFFIAGSVVDGGIGAVVGHEMEQRIYEAANEVEASCEALLASSNPIAVVRREISGESFATAELQSVDRAVKLLRELERSLNSSYTGET